MIYSPYKLHYTTRFILAILLYILLPLSTNAASLPRSGTAPAYHSLQGQPGIIKLSLTNMTQFMVIKTGDPRHATGELHKIKLHLVNRMPGTTEYFDYDWTSAFMHNQTRHKQGGMGYVPIHRRDIILAHRRHRLPVWIYVHPGDRIRLEVTARELDCTNQRVCSRGDNSYYGFDMKVPNFTIGPPSTCTAQNKWTLHQVSSGHWRFSGTPRPIAQYPITERGDLRIYPVTGTICFTSDSVENVIRPLHKIIRPLNAIIGLPGLFNKSKSKTPTKSTQ